MDKRARRIGWTLALVVAVAAASSVFTIYADSRINPEGSFRIVVKSQRGVELPFLATFLRGGGIVTSTIPLGCMAQGEVMTPGHGSWEVKLVRGVPTAVFQIWADMYVIDPGSPASRFEGSVVIAGSSPVTLGKVEGRATITIPPGPCSEALSGPTSFAAFQLPAVQKITEN